MEHKEGISDPDPLDRSILVLQLNRVLTCQQHLWTFMREWEMDPRIRRYVMQSGFYGVYRVGHISLDWPLIMRCGHDSKIMYSWPPITGICDIDWSLLCSELLGVDDVILQCYTRAFILALLGGALFVDKTSTHVQLGYLPLLRDFIEIFHYSWGSVVSAYLYRELCRASLDNATEIFEHIILLQFWSWERRHVGRPDFARPLVSIVVPHVHDDVVMIYMIIYCQIRHSQSIH
ncbi:Serine/threonine-protein phosphatase 7 long form-like [Vitis vinifera]|uniref:Serine/threonine-protein phosphatase 7 long form-like n=1 Tax=Vitis vinifera TaxID=29760 RepID=A0A438BQX3_VITVI|nr:Serine/threonine-protein phosphatase 7 long form-like [Vitis vinifera]